MGKQFCRARASYLGCGRRIGLGHIQPGIKQVATADQPRTDTCRSATTDDQRSPPTGAHPLAGVELQLILSDVRRSEAVVEVMQS